MVSGERVRYGEEKEWIQKNVRIQTLFEMNIVEDYSEEKCPYDPTVHNIVVNMSWTSLSDFELIKAEVALCEGALYVGASHADMYYQMSFGTKSTGERKERVEAILTAMFFNSPDVFLPGDYTIEYRESELLLVGLTSTDYGWHNGYDQDTVESAHHEMCSCFKEELLALGLSEEEINTAIASEAIYITASFGPDDKGSMTAEGALEVMLDTVDKIRD